MVRLAAFVAAGWLPPQASGASRLGVVWAADGSFDALYGNVAGCLSEGIFFWWGRGGKNWIRERAPLILSTDCCAYVPLRLGKRWWQCSYISWLCFLSLGVNLSVPWPVWPTWPMINLGNWRMNFFHEPHTQYI